MEERECPCVRVRLCRLSSLLGGPALCESGQAQTAIMLYLATHRAAQPGEIAAGLDMPKGTVQFWCKRLREAGLLASTGNHGKTPGLYVWQGVTYCRGINQG